MRKLKLLLIALTMLIGGGNLAWAQTSWLPASGSGEFFLKNVGTGTYLKGDSYWGTKAVVWDDPYVVTLTYISDGVYTIKTQQNNGGNNQYITNGEDLYVDGAACNMTFTEVDANNHYYTINNGTGNLYATQVTEDGASLYKVMAGDVSTDYAKWKVIKKDELIADLSSATSSTPIDATFFIKDAGIDVKSVNASSWTTSNVDLGGGGNAGHNAESWNKASFNMSQSVTGLPNGKYKATCYGYYRWNNDTNNNNAAAVDGHASGDEVLNAIFFAGTQETPLMSVAGDADAMTFCQTMKWDDNTPNYQWQAAACFTKGYYLNTIDDVMVTNGTMNIGVKKTTQAETDWCVFDEFKLFYYGNAVEVYNPAAFTSGGAATADTWYAFTVVSTGVYKITSTAAATISYTQDDSDDADDDVSTISIPTSGKAIVELSEGTFYFKSSAASTITITAATNDLDITDMINNAAVTSTTGWTNGRTSSGEKFTGAPDETYMDTWNDTRSQNQNVTLPAGYYLLKCATRGDATISTNPNIYVYSYTSDSNLGSTNIHLEGSAGNLLDKGWAWTYVPFTLSSADKVGIGFWANCEDGKWAGADDFHLTYYTSELAMKQGHLAQVVADANAWGDKISTTTALETALAASAPSCSSVSDCNTAISNLTSLIATARSTVNAYADFVRAKSGADAMVLVENTNASAASTLTSVASAQSTAAEAAETLSDVNTALSTLRTAIKTFISSAEPSNDGEYFDITCLMENPNFDGDITKWTYASAPGVAWSNCEYYQTEFDINQTVTGLPTGSYSLNVQAFQRPGWADAVWTAYNGGTDNATSVLYINSITSKVKNIAADAQSTAKLGTSDWGTWPNDSRVGSEGSYKYLPNSQQGAKLYFDSNLYDATCAAVVTSADEGSLKLGFKSTADYVDGDWTIFDNFRLRYYGSSLFIYYKQYLPQLKDEVSADLSNGTYTNVFVSSENEALEAALDAEPEAETEEAYEDVINGILNAQTAFRNAKTAYDAMVAAKAYSALTKVSDNIGSNPFQYNATTNNSLFIAYETAKAAVDDYTFTTSSTADGAQTLVDALDDAIDAYNNQTLNVPDGEKEYALVVATSGHSREGKSVIITLGSTSANNPTGYSFTAQSESIGPRIINFTQVSGNNYNISYQTDGSTTVYLTYGSLNGSAAGWKTQQIQGTTDTDKKGTFRIVATTTDNVFKIWNTVDENYIDCQDGGSIYTDNNITADEFTLQEITSMTIAEDAAADPEQRVANVTLKRAFNKGWNAVCLPFSTPAFDDAEIAEFSSETKVDNNVTIKLKKVDKFIANTPYLVYFPEAVAANKTFNAVAVDPTDVKKEGTDFDFLGTFKCKDIETGDWVISSGILRKAVATINLKPLRTYFVQKVNEARSLDFSFDDDTTTSITVIERDGQMEIVNDAYNLSGQKVNGQLKKGIYIINGKKTVIK